METPLVVHVVVRLDFGGLENGVVNLVNEMPREVARHSIISLTEATTIVDRIQRRDVTVHCLGKKAGKDLMAYVRLYRLLRRLRPNVVHTRNLGTIDCQAVAFAARVKHRIHGEHGWDVADGEGASRKYRLLRRFSSSHIERFVTLTDELSTWLTDEVGVPHRKVTKISNGVDVERFSPVDRSSRGGPVVIGTVSRFSEIKDPLNTLYAFARLVDLLGSRGSVRMVMVGDGPLRSHLQRAIRELGLGDSVELVGSQLDTAPWFDRMDIFVLGSRREGVSNTVLEAMAAGLPVVATRTGGNCEIVVEDVTGVLVDTGSPEALAAGMHKYVVDVDRRAVHGCAGRARIVSDYSLDRMVQRYSDLYRKAIDSGSAD